MKRTLIGTTVVRKSAYALDKFLSNQKEMQLINSNSELIIATDEHDFKDCLVDMLNKYEMAGAVIGYTTEMPDYAKDSRIWSMSAGREAIRRHVLENTDADWLFSVDADMTFEPNAINILKENVNGRAAIQSGYYMRNVNTIGFSLGCALLRRDVLEQLKFRCCEFKNGQVIEEGNMFEYDMVKKGIKMVKGLFLEIRHYRDNTDFVSTIPNKLPLSKRITTHPLLRYGLIAATILLKYDISRAIFDILYRNSYIQTLKEIEEAESR